MIRQTFLITLCVGFMFLLPLPMSLGRGFGGYHGGGGGFRGGGGFAGNPLAGRNLGGAMPGLGGIDRGAGGFGGAMPGAGGFNRGANVFGGGVPGLGEINRGAGGLGGNPRGINESARNQLNRGEFGGNGYRGQGMAGERAGLGGAGYNRFSSPSRSQLNSFLDLPSDEGLQNLGGAMPYAGENENIHHGSYEGPRGGSATGTAVTGPRGNTVGRGAAVGPYGGTVAGRGFEGEGDAAGIQAVAKGPLGRVAAGGAIEGPRGGKAARGAIVGPHGAAAGYARVSPSGRYQSAGAVRHNFHNWGIYGPGWYARHPVAWYPVGWAAGAAWATASWASLGIWMDYYPSEPVYYNYGTNVIYQDGNVYINGQDMGTEAQYYQQASDLAAAGTQQEASPNEQWMPLGVFALSKPDQKKI